MRSVSGLLIALLLASFSFAGDSRPPKMTVDGVAIHHAGHDLYMEDKTGEPVAVWYRENAPPGLPPYQIFRTRKAHDLDPKLGDKFLDDPVVFSEALPGRIDRTLQPTVGIFPAQVPMSLSPVVNAPELLTVAPQLMSGERFTKIIVDGVEVSADEKEMLYQLNAFRARQRLGKLVITEPLMERARAHARWMANSNSMTHSSGIQENIAMMQRNPLEVTNVWINSGGHNANMRTQNKEAGVAVAVSRNGTKFWCQQFATGSLAWKATAVPRAIVRTTANAASNVAYAVHNHRPRLFGRRRG